MKFINGLTILLIYQLAGEITVLLFRIPVPGPVLGMIMLFLTLVVRRRSAQSLELASNSLLSHLALLFVPAGVGIVVHFERIVEEWFPLTAALLASTVITMIATAAIMLGSIRLLARGDSRDE